MRDKSDGLYFREFIMWERRYGVKIAFIFKNAIHSLVAILLHRPWIWDQLLKIPKITNWLNMSLCQTVLLKHQFPSKDLELLAHKPPLYL